MLNPIGSDPQRLPKGGYHVPASEYEGIGSSPADKPGFVKPGGGRNKDMGGMDAMPEFEGMTSYKSTPPIQSRTDFGQATYLPANKSKDESSKG